MKEGDTTDELILNFGEGEKWTFYREKPKNPAPAPQPPAKEIEKKIKSLQDQIDELRKQQDALIKERELQARSEAEQAKRFAKVEIRGKLVKGKTIRGITSPWQVAINELVLPVNYNDGKLQALVEKYAGKEVVITGSIVFGIEMVQGKYESPVDFNRFITVRIDSLKLAEK